MSIVHSDVRMPLVAYSAAAPAGSKVRLPEFVISHVPGKRVLDMGSIGHDFEARQQLGTFYLAQLAAVADYVKGIDILEADVQKARSQGYNIELGDAETFMDNQPYDVIFAGELIEHLSNAGRFLQCCCTNLKENGTLIVTTPNAFSLSRIVKVISQLTNEPPVNKEHTCYYTPKTLSHLVSREKLVVEGLYYADYDYGQSRHSTRKRAMLRLNSVVTDWMPQLSQSIVAVIRKSRPGN